MEKPPLSPRAFARPRTRIARAREPAAWALPPIERFNGLPANDDGGEPVVMADLPRWVIVLAGAVFAAALGALLGGTLAV